MSKKALLFPVLLLFIMISSGIVSSVKGQTNGLDLRFEALSVGECVVGYGEIGPNGPLPVEWACLGNGQVRISGNAADAVPFPHPFLSIYISQDVKASGAVSVSWIGEDGSKHRIIGVIHSTETSEVLLIPSENGFGCSPEKAFRFQGVHVSDGVEPISGGALLGASVYGPPPFRDYVTVILGVEEFGTWHTVFYMVWSLTQTEIGLGQTYLDPPFITLPAAEVYKSVVKIT